jgi:hypothetical protein
VAGSGNVVENLREQRQVMRSSGFSHTNLSITP